jgi:hypothetical protein
MSPTTVNRTVIGDWAAPQYSPQARGILDRLARDASRADLRPEAILAAARAQTGLDNFGEDDFREPLDRLCASLEHDVALSAAGKTIAFGMLVRLASSRLRIEHLIESRPEITEIEIDRPIFIVGLPRTGTSHLTNLIAADPQIRSTRYWETLEPVPLDPSLGEEDPRIARAAETWAMVDAVLPHQKSLHEMGPTHVHEDIELLGLAFASPLFEGMLGPVRSYTEWKRSTDQTFAYRYFKRALQVLQYLRGGSRWVLKSPGHLEHLHELHRVFPDAIGVFTHRDPVTITKSCVTMETYLLRLTMESPDPHAVGAYWSRRCEQFMRGAVNDRTAFPDKQSLDVTFQEFMADELATVQQIYRLAGLTLDDSARGAMTSYREEHSREKHGRVEYDLTPFGIDPEERRHALRFYADRFSVSKDS